MSFMYDDKELALALRPWALAWALRDGADVAIHLDADAAVYDSLKEVSDAAVAAGVVVALDGTPVPEDGLRPDTDDFSTLGVQCPGLIAVSDRGRNWLDQWQRRVVDAPGGRQALEEFSDQQWIDTVPALFQAGRSSTPACVSATGMSMSARSTSATVGGWPTGCRCAPSISPSLTPDRPWLLTTAGVDAPRVVLSEHPPSRSWSTSTQNCWPRQPPRILTHPSTGSTPLRTAPRSPRHPPPLSQRPSCGDPSRLVAQPFHPIPDPRTGLPTLPTGCGRQATGCPG